MKQFLIGCLIGTFIALAIYHGIMYGLVSIVLFISDVIVQIGSTIW